MKCNPNGQSFNDVFFWVELLVVHWSTSGRFQLTSVKKML